MSRDPPGIAATDFKGSGEPLEKGRTESWKVPREVLPTQPSGTAAAVGKAASNTVVRIRITSTQTPPLDKSRTMGAIALRFTFALAFDSRRSLGTHGISKYRLLKVVNRDIIISGIDHSLSLELHPHPIGSRPREIYIELHIGSTVGDERMGVDQVY